MAYGSREDGVIQQKNCRNMKKNDFKKIRFTKKEAEVVAVDRSVGQCSWLRTESPDE